VDLAETSSDNRDGFGGAGSYQKLGPQVVDSGSLKLLHRGGDRREPTRTVNLRNERPGATDADRLRKM
jgi:hypothetical protein